MITKVANIVVGRKDVDLTAPSHVKGVHEGNRPPIVRRRPAGTRTRSTGINADDRAPIDARMPKLTPP